MPAHPLVLRDFRRLCFVRLTSDLAMTGIVVALGYQIYDLARRQGLSIGHASFELGVLGLVQFMPLLVLTPLAGVAADRFDRRLVVALALFANLLTALVMALITLGGRATLPALFALGGVIGAARVFQRPAMSAIAPNILPPALLPRGIAVASIAMQIGSVAGPALAGLLYARGAAAPYWLSAALLAASGAVALRIGPVPPPAAARESHPWTLVAQGFGFVAGDRFLLGCVTLDLFAVLLGGATALLPAYARDILHVGPEGLGAMRAAPALGAAAVAALLATRPIERRVGAKMLWAVAVYGLATVVFGISTWYLLSLAMLVLLGAADMVSVFIRNALVQLRTPDPMRGRVAAISGLAISASNELGEMESGFAASLLGPLGAVLLGGVAAVLITGLWAVIFPEIRAVGWFVPAGEQETRR